MTATITIDAELSGLANDLLQLAEAATLANQTHKHLQTLLTKAAGDLIEAEDAYIAKMRQFDAKVRTYSK